LHLYIYKSKSKSKSILIGYTNHYTPIYHTGARSRAPDYKAHTCYTVVCYTVVCVWSDGLQTSCAVIQCPATRVCDTLEPQLACGAAGLCVRACTRACTGARVVITFTHTHTHIYIYINAHIMSTHQRLRVCANTYSLLRTLLSHLYCLAQQGLAAPYAHTLYYVCYFVFSKYLEGLLDARHG